MPCSYKILFTQVTSALNFMVRMTSELETNIVAVERTEEYAKQPSEVRETVAIHTLLAIVLVHSMNVFPHHDYISQPA